MDWAQEAGILAIVSEKLLTSRAPRVTRVLDPSPEQLRWWHAAGLTPHGQPPGGGRPSLSAPNAAPGVFALELDGRSLQSRGRHSLQPFSPALGELVTSWQCPHLLR